MGKLQSAQDWEFYSEEVEYSPSTDLYWHNDSIYDKLSALHNGIIGLGAVLKAKATQLRDENNDQIK